MRAALRSGVANRRRRAASLSAVPPPRSSPDYSHEYAALAASILYRSPVPLQSGLPVYILNAAAFPDAFEVDYSSLLGYVLDRLPGEEELIAGGEYEVIFFAGGQAESATSEKKTGPGNMWYLQAYQTLDRAVRKRLQRLYVVHERSWVRVLIEIFSTIVSPKFKKKIVHVNSLSSLALHLPIEHLLIPPSVYLHDRRVSPDIYAPYVSGRRAFNADEPILRNGLGERRLPRVLRETATFICQGGNIQTEGLFRITPHSQLLGVLRESYDRGQRFIVWKEGFTTWAQPGMDPALLRDLAPQDTYNVHLAAGLIKLWYRELKTPIFDEFCYEEVRNRFPPDAEPTIDDLTNLFSASSTRSLLSLSARLIATWHLLPLLSLVSSYEATNKMNASNLAICFAPALVFGSDQMADAKMTSVVKRLLESAIEAWPRGLREACNMSPDAFASAIRPPQNPRDYEDPLYEQLDRDPSDEPQAHRIELLDEGDVESRGPPLPPRPRARTQSSYPARQDSLASPVKRKPAPQTPAPPSYTTSVQAEQASNPPLRHFSGVSRHAHVRSFDSDAQELSNEDAEKILGGSPDLQSRKSSQSDLMKELKASLVMDMSKRKPVSTSPLDHTPSVSGAVPQRSVSDTPMPTTTTTTTMAASNGDSMFVKPTWAASSRQVSAPVRPTVSISTSSTTTPATTSIATPLSATATTAQTPPPFLSRTPSPSLLTRLNSLESIHRARSTTTSNPSDQGLLPSSNRPGLGLKKASVDDLKRLYEERACTVEKLNQASAARRASSAGGAAGRS